jgi:hypothetical protein
MNRLSELQTIVKVSKICNNNGLTKEADQLLNIFNKLAQENAETSPTNNTTEPKSEPAPEAKPTQAPEQTPQELTSEDNSLVNELITDMNSYKTLTINVFDKLKSISSMDEIKNIKPDLTQLIEVSNRLVKNPFIDEESKTNISANLSPILEINDSV